jgi:hypothetical protein
MFRLAPLTKRTTATLLLVVFLHMLVGQCLCAAMCLTLGREQALVTKTLPTDPHACCKKAGPVKTHLTASKPAPAKSGHDCCQDNSAAILKAMSAPSTKLVLDGPLLVSLPPTQDFTFVRFTAWNAAAPVVLVPRQHLPPKIPNIRVFLRSLTV